MPDKKLTDNEIKKALEGAILNAKKCDSKVWSIEVYKLEKALDLISCLQAKAIKEQNKNSKLRNERNRLQAQNKDLAETVHNLTIEKDALFDKVEELKAEIERLKEENECYAELEQGCYVSGYKKIKAEAYKEFSERVKKLPYDPSYTNLHKAVDNPVKEMVGERPPLNDVKCNDCEYLEFELPYAVCSKAHKGIVAPDDGCGKGKLKEMVGEDNA